jgi:hypothetical protein
MFLAIGCYALHSRFQLQQAANPPSGRRNSTMCGKSRSFIRGVRSPLRRVMTQTDQSPKIQLRHYLMTSRSSLAVSDFNHEILSNHRDGGSVELYG